MFRYARFIATSIAALSLACGGQEQRAIDTFFGAVQSGDEAARSAVSSVDFPEEVESWEAVDVGTESTEPFRLPELRARAQEAKGSLDLHNEKGGYFIRDNKRLYEEYQAQLQKDPGHTFKGELAEFHEEWQEILEQQKDLEAKLEEATAAMQRERATAAISLMGASVTEGFDGEVSIREATVNVNGAPYRVTLRNYNLVNKTTNARPRSRWIITEIQKQ